MTIDNQAAQQVDQEVDWTAMARMLKSFVDRRNFNRTLEPLGNGVLHGAGQDPGVGRRYDPDPFHAYWHAMDRDLRPIIYMSYVPLKANMSAYFDGLRHAISEYEPYQIMPQIGLYMNGEA